MNPWVSILKWGTPCAGSAWTNRWLDVDLLSSSAPGTARCRSPERTRWELVLWLPWTAGHPPPPGDPGGCSWCGTWCTDGWAEVDEELRAHPILDTTVLVARQVPSKLRHCGAKSARRAPTCNPSAVASWGSRSSYPRLPVLRWNGTLAVSLAGSDTKGLVLGDCFLNGRSCLRRISRTQKLWLGGSSWRKQFSSCWTVLAVSPWSSVWRSQMTRPCDPPAGWSEPAWFIYLGKDGKISELEWSGAGPWSMDWCAGVSKPAELGTAAGTESPAGSATLAESAFPVWSTTFVE